MKRVLLSSTAKDLGRHREAVYKAISGMDGYVCVRMEDFGARDFAADAFCWALVKECSVFLGLIGHLYGSSPEGSETSFTEREYDAAVQASVPGLLFIAAEDFSLPANLLETEERRQRQMRFRERVMKDRIVASFTEPDALAVEVVKALRNSERDNAERGKSVEVFLSYRRSDAAGYAHLIHILLQERLSTGRVFIDVDSIKPGCDFLEEIEQGISSCSVCLVLIGPHWLANGRLEQPHDSVRLEVITALRHGIRIIPLLVDGTPMPSPDELPEALRPLARKQAFEMRGASIGSDADRLASLLAGITAEQEISKKSRVTVHFTSGSARLSEFAEVKLAEVALKMRQAPEIPALVIGYSDASGSDRVSKLRAEAVKHSLVARHGIDPNRIETKGRSFADSTGFPEEDRRAVIIFSVE